MVKLTDRPDMTLDVYRGRKTTNQQQQPIHLKVRQNEKWLSCFPRKCSHLNVLLKII